LPGRVMTFLKEADQRIDQFVARRLDNPVPGFVPSDFPPVYQMLQTVKHLHLAPGNRFCEWGCGFGVIASLASMLGFEAYGIEIEDELVEAAQSLAAAFDIQVDFVRGSFIPVGGEAFTDAISDFHWLVMAGENAYDQLELEPNDFDVIFAYPWPGEEVAVISLFERYAASGAILVTYHGCEGLRVRRKSVRRRRKM